MTTLAIFLVILSAGLHTTWNVLGKTGQPTPAFFAVATAASGLVTAPFLFLGHGEMLPTAFWMAIGLTGCCQALYYVGLANAYAHADISLAYPLIRAIPVLGIMLLGYVFNTQQAPTVVAACGMIAVSCGAAVLPMRNFRSRPFSGMGPAGIHVAAAAFGTIGYTVIDYHAMALLLACSQAPTLTATLLFTALETWMTMLVVFAVVGARKSHRRELCRLLTGPWRRAAVAGVICTSAYGLVLAAMTCVKDVSYVAAFRQLSIPITAIVGMTALGESRTTPKCVGVALLAAGLVMVALD